ncbi:MAG: Por secretion system protein [Prevotella sp.]|nr:Por secretion system protein [Prevotella sp.]
MKRILIAALFILSCSALHAQIGTWRAYMAYHQIQQIRAAGDEVFVLSSDNLWSYNRNDHQITTYDKTQQLSDTYITQIAWVQQARRLVIAYQNANIDLLSTNGDVVNVSDIYSKAITGDKTINSITVDGQYAYLACGFGIVKLNVRDAEVSETYMLDFNVQRVALSSGSIYARSTSGSVWKAALDDNLLDKSQWSQTASYPAGIFNEDTADYDEHYPTAATLNPGGPKYNYFFDMKYVNNRLYTCGGSYTSTRQSSRPGTVQVYNGTDWTIYQDSLQNITGHRYEDVDAIDIDPRDPEHVIVGSRTGLYEFQNGRFVKADNSALYSAVINDDGTQNPDYVLALGVKYDSSGHLYVLNSQARHPIAKLSGSTWSHIDNELMMYSNGQMTMGSMRGMITDHNGVMWFVNDHWDNPALVSFNPATEEVRKYDDFTNQDGTSYELQHVFCVTEDKEGNIWVGTDLGPFVLEAGASSFIQVKVPRNDGTNYADYLLYGLPISCIAIDGGNRKWIGTQGNGVYVISADNMTQVYNFTSLNSDLLSDIIESMAINDQTGEVFIGTDKGLCSYMSDATATNEEMTKDNVYAYPNPVTPDYTGLITIVGLSYDADVKILTAAGTLVAEGRSNGGTFTWDGCDRNGRRVASGVYMVAAATSEGKKGTVCKIAVIR